MPDIYQGNEIWDWSLVDPDNRRPVDYSLRRRYLEDVKRLATMSADHRVETLRQWLETAHDGRCKLHVTWVALQFRRAHEALFRDGSYIPLRVAGEHAAHVLAYARKLGDELAIVAVPRLCLRLMGARDGLPCGRDVWGDTRIELPRKMLTTEFRNVVTGNNVAASVVDHAPWLALADVFADFPVALATS